MSLINLRFALILALIINYLVYTFYKNFRYLIQPKKSPGIKSFARELLMNVASILIGLFWYVVRYFDAKSVELNSFPSPLYLWPVLIVTASMIYYFLPEDPSIHEKMIMIVGVASFTYLIIITLIAQIRGKFIN